MTEKRLKDLLKQYFENNIGIDDCEELLNHLGNSDENDREIANQFDEFFKTNVEKYILPTNRKEYLFQKIKEKTRDSRSYKEKGRRSFKINFNAAAAFLLSVSILALVLYNNTNRKASINPIVALEDITLPENNSAFFTFSDGRSIEISDSLSGIISSKDGIRLERDTEGNLYYRNEALSTSNQDVFNTFHTAKGNTFQLTLSDGTKVWLNTSTTIRFPDVFSNNVRRIELSGEAYFEVAHDSSNPFEINVNNTIIKVLGTKFNVSAYKDESAITTSLVEGSVQVHKNNKSTTLNPLEQVTVNSQSGEISEKSAFNIRAIEAWRNGYFYFDQQTIESMIQSLSSWYDIETINITQPSTDKYSGTFKRSKDLSELLNHLSKISTMNFTIEGRTVTVKN